MTPLLKYIDSRFIEQLGRTICCAALVIVPLFYSSEFYRVRDVRWAALLFLGFFLLASVLYSIIRGGLQRSLWRLPAPVRLPLLALGTWELIGLLWAPDLALALRRIMMDLVLVVFLGVFCHLGRERRTWHLFLTLTFTVALLVNWLAIYQLLGGRLGLEDFLPAYTADRATGPFGNPNFLAHYLAATSLLGVGWALFGSGKRIRLLAAITAVLGFQTLLLTQSRGPLLAFILTAVALGAFYVLQTHSRKVVTAAGIALALIIGLNLSWWPQHFISRFQADSISNRFRPQAYSDTIRMVSQKPWGIGRGQTEIVFPAYRMPRPEAASMTRAVHIHCDPLEWTAEWGVFPGLPLALWLLFVALHWMRLKLHFHRSRVPWLGMAMGLLLCSLVSFPIHNPTPGLFFAFAWGMALIRPYKATTTDMSPRWKEKTILIVSIVVLLMTMILAVRWAVMPLQASRMHRAALLSKNSKVSQQLFQDATAMQPEDADLLFDAGIDRLKNGDSESAAVLFQRYVDRFPVNFKAWYNLGVAAMNQNDSGTARVALETAYRLQQFYPATSGQMGKLEWMEGRLLQAEYFFNQAANLQPTKSQPYYNLAVFYIKIGQMDKARNACQRALHLNPRNEKVVQLWRELKNQK